MRVGYSRKFVAFNLAIGLGFVLLALATPHSTAFLMYVQLGVGACTLLITPFTLVRPLFEVGDNQITLFALIGPVKRKFPFSDKREVRVEGDRIYVGSRRLPVKRWVCNRTDWDRFVASLTFD
jgi:hypothetical protein